MDKEEKSIVVLTVKSISWSLLRETDPFYVFCLLLLWYCFYTFLYKTELCWTKEFCFYIPRSPKGDNIAWMFLHFCVLQWAPRKRFLLWCTLEIFTYTFVNTNIMMVWILFLIFVFIHSSQTWKESGSSMNKITLWWKNVSFKVILIANKATYFSEVLKNHSKIFLFYNFYEPKLF